MQEYADPVIDWLDGGRGMFAKRLFRDVRPRSTADPHAINHPVLPLTVSLTTTPPFSSDWRSGLLFTALQSCVQHTNGAYMKDLACMGEDLESVALIDNSPISYALNQGSSAASAALPSSLPDRRWISPLPPPSLLPLAISASANGIPIDGWFSDPNDQALLDLLPVLDSLRFTGDVRHVLGLRGF